MYYLIGAFEYILSKYDKPPYHRDRIIPIVIRHNGTMYMPSRELFDIVLPELSDAFMSKQCLLSIWDWQL